MKLHCLLLVIGLMLTRSFVHAQELEFEAGDPVKFTKSSFIYENTITSAAIVAIAEVGEKATVRSSYFYKRDIRSDYDPIHNPYVEWADIVLERTPAVSGSFPVDYRQSPGLSLAHDVPTGSFPFPALLPYPTVIKPDDLITVTIAPTLSHRIRFGYDTQVRRSGTNEEFESVGGLQSPEYEPGKTYERYFRIPEWMTAGLTSPLLVDMRTIISFKGVEIASREVIGAITVQSPPSITVVATDAEAGEPGSGSEAGVFTFSRSGSTAAALTVHYTVGGTATAGTDYTSLGTSVTFAAGAATAVRTVSVLDDALVEEQETVAVTLAAGSGYMVGSPSTAAVNIADDDGVGASYVTDRMLGTARNNITGFVGMRVQVGAAPLKVTALGRMFAPGNNRTHTLKLVRASDGTDVPGGSAAVSMTGGTTGQFRYAALAVPVTLSAETIYYVVSQETSGGDFWHDQAGTKVTTTAAALVLSAVYKTTGAWTTAGGAGRCYGPVDFKYTGGASVPSATSTAVGGAGSRLRAGDLSFTGETSSKARSQLQEPLKKLEQTSQDSEDEVLRFFTDSEAVDIVRYWSGEIGFDQFQPIGVFRSGNIVCVRFSGALFTILVDDPYIWRNSAVSFEELMHRLDGYFDEGLEGDVLFRKESLIPDAVTFPK